MAIASLVMVGAKEMLRTVSLVLKMKGAAGTKVFYRDVHLFCVIPRREFYTKGLQQTAEKMISSDKCVRRVRELELAMDEAVHEVIKTMFPSFQLSKRMLHAAVVAKGFLLSFSGSAAGR